MGTGVTIVALSELEARELAAGADLRRLWCLNSLPTPSGGLAFIDHEPVTGIAIVVLAIASLIAIGGVLAAWAQRMHRD